ncbi:MAG: alpha/beta hydrolase [Spirochaetes bacterium]|nr:alpha/beta hydrolase [Spirochaetota bacterium]
MPEVKKIAVGDVEIEYLDYPSSGDALVMLHATGFLPWLWHPIARELHKEYRIVAPYFCDHRHAEPEEGLEWMRIAQDLYEFCTALRLTNPFCVGHSMGATVITLAEAVYGPFARKMMLIEPIFLPENLYGIDIAVEQHPLAAKAIKRRNFWENRQEARKYLRSKKLFEKWTDEMLDLYIEYGMIEGKNGGLMLACHPRREAALFMGGIKYNPWPLLPKVKCPVLVLEGEDSENRPFIDLKKAASLFAHGEHKLIPNAGHLIPMEKPEEIIEIIKEYAK